MSFDSLVQFVVKDTVGASGSLWAFRAELGLCGVILLTLLWKMFAPRWRLCAFYTALFGLMGVAALAFPWSWLSAGGGIARPATIFTGALAADSFTIVLRGLLLLFALLFVTFTQMSRTPDYEDTTEFYVLVLGALLGMFLMISANHVLIVLMGMEMASVPCYILAGQQRRRSKSSEAALKYAVFGAGSAGIMLYGMSLLVGVLGSAQLPTMTSRLAEMLGSPTGLSVAQTSVLILGGLMLMIGVAYKLSAVPFHFWAPDVFEGATAEVAAFLSVASKAAALGLLVRLAAGFAFPSGLTFPPSPSGAHHLAAVAALAPVRQYIVTIVSLLAAVTCTFGNLAAYGQTNMKRLLAYSTIAHAGYMMMPVAAAVALVGADPVDDPSNAIARSAIASMVIYIGIYLFMNLAAFAIVAILRNELGSEEIADYAGLARYSPGLTVCMALVLFSLVGLPPLAGFSAKFFAFGALVQAKLWALLFIGVLNTLLSLFYYLRVVKVMVLAPEPLYHDVPSIPLTSMLGSYCLLLTLPVVLLFFNPTGLVELARAAADAFFR